MRIRFFLVLFLRIIAQIDLSKGIFQDLLEDIMVSISRARDVLERRFRIFIEEKRKCYMEIVVKFIPEFSKKMDFEIRIRQFDYEMFREPFVEGAICYQENAFLLFSGIILIVEDLAGFGAEDIGEPLFESLDIVHDSC